MIKLSAYLKLIAEKSIRGGLIITVEKDKLPAVSNQVSHSLVTMSLHFDHNDIFINGVRTSNSAREVFAFMQMFPNSNIIVTGKTQNVIIQNLLKAAMDGHVSLNDESFDFNGSLIFMVPTLDDLPQTFVDRSLFCKA